jgi:hypothetical protein
MISPRALAMLGLVLGLAGSPSERAHLPVTAVPSRVVRPESWSPISQVGSAAPSSGQLAVWTGSEMIVWGGFAWTGHGYEVYDRGGRYDPESDAWRVMTDVGAPSLRTEMTGVWTGTELIVWGGVAPGGGALNTGARYDPALDLWRPMATPTFLVGRSGHSAVWTGALMIVWGGENHGLLGDGGAYDPVTDRWTPPAPAPDGGRRGHVAVWTGREMIIWGGVKGYGTDSFGLTTAGLRYDPRLDSWSAMSIDRRPIGSALPKAVWTGSHMLVVCPLSFYDVPDGGNGYAASYDPASDAWETLPALEDWRDGCSPFFHSDLPIVWTGKALVLFGATGVQYQPASGAWRMLRTRRQPLHTCFGRSAVWTGSLVILWGPGPEFSGIWTPGG